MTSEIFSCKNTNKFSNARLFSSNARKKMLIRNFSIILYDSNQQFDNTFWIEAPRPDGKEKQGSLLHGDIRSNGNGWNLSRLNRDTHWNGSGAEATDTGQPVGAEASGWERDEAAGMAGIKCPGNGRRGETGLTPRARWLFYGMNGRFGRNGLFDWFSGVLV